MLRNVEIRLNDVEIIARPPRGQWSLDIPPQVERVSTWGYDVGPHRGQPSGGCEL